MHSCLLGKNAFFHKLLVVAMFETFVPRGDFIWVPRTKIILRQLSDIDNTEMACCENSEAICILAHLWLDLAYHGKEAEEVDLQNFPPPSLLFVSC